MPNGHQHSYRHSSSQHNHTSPNPFLARFFTAKRTEAMDFQSITNPVAILIPVFIGIILIFLCICCYSSGCWRRRSRGDQYARGPAPMALETIPDLERNERAATSSANLQVVTNGGTAGLRSPTAAHLPLAGVSRGQEASWPPTTPPLPQSYDDRPFRLSPKGVV